MTSNQEELPTNHDIIPTSSKLEAILKTKKSRRKGFGRGNVDEATTPIPPQNDLMCSLHNVVPEEESLWKVVANTAKKGDADSSSEEDEEDDDELEAEQVIPTTNKEISLTSLPDEIEHPINEISPSPAVKEVSNDEYTLLEGENASTPKATTTNVETQACGPIEKVNEPSIGSTTMISPVPIAKEVTRDTEFTTVANTSPEHVTAPPVSAGTSCINKEQDDSTAESDPVSDQDSEENKEPAPSRPTSQEQLLDSIDGWFAQVTDPSKVSTRDIMDSLRTEYPILDKADKRLIRERLVELVTEAAQQGDDDDGPSDEEEDTKQDQGESSDAENPDDGYSTDDEQDAPKRKRPTKKSTKLALKVHAEQRRKRQALQVRTEELQASARDQQVAVDIARKFEIEMDTIPQRVALLDKLDAKRLGCIAKVKNDEKPPKEDEPNKPEPVNEEPAETPAVEMSDSDSEDDEDLEIEGGNDANPDATLGFQPPVRVAPVLLLGMKVLPVKHTSPVVNDRRALRKLLQQKQRTMGNQWLARELGYKDEKEHLLDCRAAEEAKRNKILQAERARLQAVARQRQRLLEGTEEKDTAVNEDSEDESDPTYQGEEEDEELVLAKQIAQDGSDPFENSKSEDLEVENASTIDGNDEEEVAPQDSDHASTSLSRTEIPLNEALETTNPEGGETGDSNHTDSTEAEELLVAEKIETEESATQAKNSGGDDEPTTANDGDARPKTARNAGWKALLEKDAAASKRKKKSGLVDEEADEEEEEEVAGLEDFGFVVKSKKQEEDDCDPEVFNEDDLEHVVDDLSDGEGDEEAGERARKALERKLEKERHKEVIRRMRDGYDGRRGGIAGGGLGARGVHRFDELVAADNREGAKKLGLLNDDELNSDDEGKEVENGDEEEDDENKLIEKMLDRHLQRTSVAEEVFSDDEKEDDEGDRSKVEVGKEHEAEQEQERLAKRFAKRARMQRLIEAHGHEEEFSQSKLIDEDASMKIELGKMKDGLVRKRSSSSNVSSVDGSKRQKTGTLTTSLLHQGGSLALALQASRRRTKFARAGTTGSSSGHASSSSYRKCIAFSHVVFQHGSESNRSESKSSSNAGRHNPAKKPASGVSLFSKSILAGLQKKRKA